MCQPVDYTPGGQQSVNKTIADQIGPFINDFTHICICSPGSFGQFCNQSDLLETVDCGDHGNRSATNYLTGCGYGYPYAFEYS